MRSINLCNERVSLVSVLEIVEPPEILASSPKPAPLIALFDPTQTRQETANRLAQVGGWRGMHLDTNRSDITGPAMEAITSLAGNGGNQAPAAFVLEAYYPIRTVEEDSSNPIAQVAAPIPAKETINCLKFRYQFDFTPFILYTKEEEALAQARQDFDFARRSGRSRVSSFDATLQRNPSAEADLALVQLLDHLIIPQIGRNQR